MFAVVVTLEVKPERLEAFLPLMSQNAMTSLRDERGCRRFDICSDPARPGDVFLYELYVDQSAFEGHLASAHYKSFDAQTADMIVAKHVRTYSLVAS
ncbi:MAG: putative quinol monooxygenase [Pseudomonadota bacterium]